MNESEKFEQYKKLMYLALDDPSDVFEICSKVIISMSLVNEHSEKDFKEILDFMMLSFKYSPSIEQVMMRVMQEENGL